MSEACRWLATCECRDKKFAENAWAYCAPHMGVSEFSMSNNRGPNWQVSRAVAFGVACVLALAAQSAAAGPREQAKRMYDRIAGVPPSEAQIQQMATMIQGGDSVGAA